MAANATLLVDTHRWPLVVLTYAGAPSNALLEAHLREIEQKVLSRDEAFVQIIDQKKGVMPDAVQRSLIADHQEKMELKYAKYCLGEAYVVTPDLRAAMTAVFWLAKPPYPYVFVDTMDEALNWCHRHLGPKTQLRR
jgi:hypothetical protein